MATRYTRVFCCGGPPSGGYFVIAAHHAKAILSRRSATLRGHGAVGRLTIGWFGTSEPIFGCFEGCPPWLCLSLFSKKYLFKKSSQKIRLSSISSTLFSSSSNLDFQLKFGHSNTLLEGVTRKRDAS